MGIHSLIIDNSLVTDESLMIQHIVNYFYSLFSSKYPSPDLSDVQHIIPRLVTDDNNSMLCRILSFDDI